MSTRERGPFRRDGFRTGRSVRRGAVRSPASRAGTRLALLVLGALSSAALARAAELEPAPENLDAREIAVRAEESMRSDRMFFEAKATVLTSRFSRPRVFRFRWFGDRPRQRTFIRILEPPRDAGTSFLLLAPNLWMHAPRDDRVTRIPEAMMSQPWMESGFSIDDLVRPASEVEHYDYRVLGIDPSPKRAGELRAYVVEYLPRAAAGSPWARIVAWIETEHGTPLRREFRDSDDDLVRVLRYDAIRIVDGRHFPHVWILEHVAEDLPETRIDVETVRFDADFEDSVFTTTNLKLPH